MLLLRQARFAELCGVSRKTVTVWKARGFLVFEEDLVEVEASIERLKRMHRGQLRLSKIVTQAVTRPSEMGNTG